MNNNYTVATKTAILRINRSFRILFQRVLNITLKLWLYTKFKILILKRAVAIIMPRCESFVVIPYNRFALSSGVARIMQEEEEGFSIN